MRGRRKQERAQPRYHQLAAQLARRIVAGDYTQGAKLAERDLAAEYAVSRFTLRNALRILETQGLLQRVPRQGTFVAASIPETRWASTATTIRLAFVASETALKEPDSYYSRICAGVRRMARVLGLTVKTETIISPVRVALQDYRPPRPAEVGGVIVCGTFDEQYISMFRSERVPLVVVDCWTHDADTDCVVVDVEGEAYTAVDYLARLGHTTLGFFATYRKERRGDVHEFDPDVFRLLHGLRCAAQRRQMELREEWILLAPGARLAVETAVDRWLAQQPRPTAAVCFHDGLGPWVLDAAGRTGIRCPEDISLITRGNGRLPSRQATCLASNPEQMGQAAVRLLLERMKGQRTEAVKLAVASRLALGTTTSPPPGRV